MTRNSIRSKVVEMTDEQAIALVEKNEDRVKDLQMKLSGLAQGFENSGLNLQDPELIRIAHLLRCAAKDVKTVGGKVTRWLDA